MTVNFMNIKYFINTHTYIVCNGKLRVISIKL